jgi:hypothetical protein
MSQLLSELRCLESALFFKELKRLKDLNLSHRITVYF